MDDIYKNIAEYNPNRKRKILIGFDDMTDDIMIIFDDMICLVIQNLIQ